MSLKIVQNRVSRVSQSIPLQQCNIVLGRSSGFHARDFFFFLGKLTPDLILNRDKNAIQNSSPPQ